MHAHAKLRVELASDSDDAVRVRMPLLRSEGALVLRPTQEQLPIWAARWDIDPDTVATVRLAAGAAGPLGGDHWRLDIEVGAGVTLGLTAVAALLALPGSGGEESWSETTVSVGEGASLIWHPGAQIAAAGCRHVAFNRIDLAAGARLFVREEVVIGRHGERPGDFRQRLRVTRDGAALYDQELAVGDAFDGWNGAAVVGTRRALGSIVMVDPDDDGLDCFGTSVTPDHPDTAVMRLARDAVVITCLAADTIELRDQLDQAFAPFSASGVPAEVPRLGEVGRASA